MTTSLASADIGTVRASASADYLAEQSIRARPFEDVRSALQALRTGKLDAVVYDLPLLAWLLEEEPGGALRLLPHTLTRQDYAFALPTGSALRERLNVEMLEQISTPEWRSSVQGY